MKRNVLVFGLISGLITTCWAIGFIIFSDGKLNIENGELYGYTSMLVAFSFIVVGVKNYRDKHLGGVISFGKAFKTGFLIALTAATVYVVSWLLYYYGTDSNFIEVYTKCVLDKMKAGGASEAEIAQQAKEMAQFAEWYKNPLFNALMTYMEILPLGTVVALITALIFKRKVKKQQ